MTELGRVLGKDTRDAQDTRGRLRDDFEAVDYFEYNSAKLGFNAVNVIVDKTYYTGSMFILGHEEKGQLDEDLLGITAGGGSSISRVLENRIWDEWEEDFTTTGSKDTANTNAIWSTTGSCIFYYSSLGLAGLGSLTGYWTLDNTLTAYVGSNLTLDGTGPEAADGGPVGSCYLFPNSGFLKQQGFDWTGSTGSYASMSQWVKTNGSLSTMAMSSVYDDSGDYGWYTDVTDGGNWYVLINEQDWSGLPSTYKAYSTSSTINDGNWHHVVFTFGDGILRLYLDGEETGSTQHRNDSLDAMYNGTGSIHFGQRDPGPAYMNGSLADISFWNKALSADEVGSLYQSGSPQYADAFSTKLSRNWSKLEIANLDKIKITLIGSSVHKLTPYGSTDGGNTWTQVLNKQWTTLTTTGSHSAWKVESNKDRVELYKVKTEWKSDDM